MIPSFSLYHFHLSLGSRLGVGWRLALFFWIASSVEHPCFIALLKKYPMPPTCFTIPSNWPCFNGRRKHSGRLTFPSHVLDRFEPTPLFFSFLFSPSFITQSTTPQFPHLYPLYCLPSSIHIVIFLSGFSYIASHSMSGRAGTGFLGPIGDFIQRMLSRLSSFIISGHVRCRAACVWLACGAVVELWSRSDCGQNAARLGLRMRYPALAAVTVGANYRACWYIFGIL